MWGRRSAAKSTYNKDTDPLFLVTEKMIVHSHKDVVERSNLLVGPKIMHDPDRGYGLFADRDYRKGETVTLYSGVEREKEFRGDYAAYHPPSGKTIDGHHGFWSNHKGRWINEFDAQRTVVNVKLGFEVRALRFIRAGEQLFADYGDDYQRAY